ncbi:hypothetical protein CRG98_026041 [Punica granatum]|uniref:Uncharacterized protein n=1 Tax=Punica granatum TaxID=22663 RepID=A0A2I0JBG6_PUNGR|nr:hypothetical protein CRG98_026041 [Punica granatum]
MKHACGPRRDEIRICTDPSLCADAKEGRTVGYAYVEATLVGIFKLSRELEDSGRHNSKSEPPFQWVVDVLEEGQKKQHPDAMA